MLNVTELNEAELIHTIGRTIKPGASLDDLGYELAFETSESMGFGLSNLWEQAKLEFRVLICTDDPRYDSVRKEAAALSPNQTTAFVSFLSAGLGAVIGVSATLLAPLVGLLLLTLIRVGTETFCRASKSNVVTP